MTVFEFMDTLKADTVLQEKAKSLPNVDIITNTQTVEVLGNGETRYIKGFKTTADFLLDTSFTYELGLISRLLGEVRRQFTLEGHNAELWDETARRFEQVDPLPLELLPADSMLCEFYGSRT